VFHNISKAIKQRMHYLESMNEKQKSDRTPLLQRLRQVPPETGKFLALLAATAPKGVFLEIGTSAGYSALWLALACKELGRKLVTFEVLEEKVSLAKETFRLAGVEDVVKLIKGDARDYLGNCKKISFCFLDAEKDMYSDCYDRIIPNMVKGGLLIADNVISHKEILKPMLVQVLNDKRVDAVVVPIGNGELVCRKL